MPSISRTVFTMEDVIRECNWLARVLDERRQGLDANGRAALLYALGGLFFMRLMGQVMPEQVEQDCKTIGNILRTQKGQV